MNPFQTVFLEANWNCLACSGLKCALSTGVDTGRLSSRVNRFLHRLSLWCVFCTLVVSSRLSPDRSAAAAADDDDDDDNNNQQ